MRLGLGLDWPHAPMVAVGPVAEATRRVVWVCPAGSEVSRPGEG